MKNIHDETFKQLLSHHSFAVAFLKQYLPDAIQQGINWETLHFLKLSGDHIEEKTGVHTLSDLIFEIKTLDGKILWVHIEHQTRSENFMPLRVMQYQSSALTGYIKNNHKIKKIPMIISIIFYQGKKRYAHSLDFKGLFVDPDSAIKYFGKPILIDLAALPDEVLHRHAITGPVELLLKHIRLPDFATRHEQLIAGLQTQDETTRSIMLKYVAEILDIPTAEFLETMRRYLPKDSEVPMTTADQFRQQGMLLSLYEVAKKMFRKGFKSEEVREITGLSKKEIKKIVETEK